MRITYLAILSLLLCITANSQDLNGTWTKEGARTSRKANVEAEFDAAIKKLPIEVIFEPAYLTFTYDDGSTLKAAYYIEENILQLATSDKAGEYKITIKEDKLTISRKNNKETVTLAKIAAQ